MFWFYILKLQDAHTRSLFFIVLSKIVWSKWFLKTPYEKCYILPLVWFQRNDHPQGLNSRAFQTLEYILYILMHLPEGRNYYFLLWIKRLQLACLGKNKSHRQRNCYSKVRLRKSTEALENQYEQGRQYEGSMDIWRLANANLR